jgi:RimJ/RimL family protein N-acetyltransferase
MVNERMRAARVELRPVTRDDLPVFFEHDHDPEASAMAGVRARPERDFYEHWGRILEDDTVIERAILADGELAGRVTCFEAEGAKTVGYWIGRDHWGRGIATRALALLLDEVTARPLVAQVGAGNAGSIRVLERCGFVAVGVSDEPGTDRYVAGRVVRYRLE